GVLQLAVEHHLPRAAVRRRARPRADHDALGIKAQDRPEPDAEAADLVGALLLARRVEREQVATRVLVAHALAVVAAADAGLALAIFDGDLDLVGAGIASVLQQLAHEDPRIRSIAISLDPRAIAKVAGRPFAHLDECSGKAGAGSRRLTNLGCSSR